jgi:hypothetical protein
MRCDQILGLPVEAIEFLRKYEVQPEACPHCKRLFDRKLEVCSYYHGMFDDPYNLYRHLLIDGRTAEEFVQADPWSSGPCMFLGLRVYDTNADLESEFLWSQEDIDNA